MPEAPLSIVIPAYNAGSWLEATIRSCLCSDSSVREIIVVDDGSTDDTPEVCRAFGGSIRFLRVANGGVSRARNTGASAASGEWLLFLDSDDLLEADGPAALIATAHGHGAGMAYGLVRERREPPLQPRITGQGHAAGQTPLPALRNYWRCAVITPGSAVIRRDLHERIGGFVSGYEPMEDRDYWIKAGLLESCAHLDRVVLDKTWRPVSAGKMDDRRIWNGLRSRLALPRWCQLQGVPWPGGLPREKRALFEAAVKEAVWCKCWAVVGALLRECRRRKLRTFWTVRAGLEFRARGGERKNAVPCWLSALDD